MLEELLYAFAIGASYAIVTIVTLLIMDWIYEGKDGSRNQRQDCPEASIARDNGTASAEARNCGGIRFNQFAVGRDQREMSGIRKDAA